MRERITAFVAIFLLLILIGASYWYAMKSTYGNLRYVPGEESPDFIAKDATVVTFDEAGVAKNKLKAKVFEHFSDDRVQMVEPQFTSVSPDEPVTHAQALKGETHDGGATVNFSGEVIVTRAAGENSAASRMETDTLTAYTDTNRLETNDFVRITNGENVATATGMVIDNIERTVELKSRVKTITKPGAGSVNLLPSAP